VLWRFYREQASGAPILNGMKNACKTVLFGSALTLLTLLSSCSRGFSAAPYAFDVGVNPNPLGFSASPNFDTGVVTFGIPAHTFIFASKAGAVGATIEGYDIEYYEASNNPAFPGDFVQRSSGSLNVYVPPGIVCDELREPDAEPAFDFCTVNSEGAVFARGPERTSPPSYVIPLDIASQLYDLVGIGGAVGAYAHIYFYGTDDLQRPFRSQEPYQMAIQIPVGDE
jgi:hypothetical protein